MLFGLNGDKTDVTFSGVNRMLGLMASFAYFRRSFGAPRGALEQFELCVDDLALS